MVDAFEIQVYDGSANAPGVPGIELHMNSVLRGTKNATEPELPQHRQSHLTLEPSLGVTSFWEVGAYLQSAVLRDGSFEWAGVKLRSKFVMPHGDGDRVRLGLNVEVAVPRDLFEACPLGSELRPILAWENSHWLFAVNPIVDVCFGKKELREGPGFQPALVALYKWEDRVSAGLEYYGDFGPIADLHAPASGVHYLFDVVNILCVDRLELNLGFGAGLTEGSNPLVAKAIVGYAWDRAAPTRTTAPR